MCSETKVDTTPKGALTQNETTSTHTSEENDDVVCIVILHWRTLGVFLASLLIPHCTGKDAYCFYIRLVCFSSQKNSSRSPPSSDYRRVASVALVSSISTRKNEFQHARHSGDKCFAEHHVGTNEDSVWIPWKHRGTQIVSTWVSIRPVALCSIVVSASHGFRLNPSRRACVCRVGLSTWRSVSAANVSAPFRARPTSRSPHPLTLPQRTCVL